MIAAATPLRTIWLMGAKTRLIPDFVAGAAVDLLPEGETLVDLCAGTGALGRYLAGRNRVIANDVQKFSATIASAHLEGGEEWARALDRLDPDADLGAASEENFAALERLEPAALAREDDLLPRAIDELVRREPGSAVEEYRRFLEATPAPDRREPGGGDAYAPLEARYSDLVEERRRDPGRAPFALVTLFYQNIYFGVRQSMRIDSLRAAIAALPEAAPHRERKTTLYLAALLYAASVSTSGTSHFAQPRSVRKDSELLAVARRRSIDIVAEFHAALDAIRREWGERPARGPHRTFRMEAEALLAAGGPLSGERIGLVYLDPPYTADHYSRFYHLLETLVEYDYPELERRRGQVTVGRYPALARRFQSRFSSPQGVDGAFRAVIARARSLGANLLVSYSPDNGLLLRRWSAAGERNAVARFRALFLEHYGQVEIRERSLLHSGQGDRNRDVRELLVLCEP